MAGGKQGALCGGAPCGILSARVPTGTDAPTVTGLVFDIQRFCIHDGPGIRTAVFLKGCPLACPWCHNPESQSTARELFYTPTLCIGCGACVAACPHGVHRAIDGAHSMDRSHCALCFGCAEACPTAALEPVGRGMTVAEVMAEAERDRVFYEQSGGGITLTGGEPLAQPAFSLALLDAARGSGLHSCVETCGFASRETVLSAAQRADLLLWDIKDTDPDRHSRTTGAPLEPILDNLRAVDREGHEALLRCILVEGVNLEAAHLDGIAALWGELGHCQGVEILPYHALGRSKVERLGRTADVRPAASDPWSPNPDRVDWARAYLAARGVQVVDAP